MTQQTPETFDGVAVSQSNCSKHRFWGSARMTYTICAFLAMIVHLCLRNTLNFVILCMVKKAPHIVNEVTSKIPVEGLKSVESLLSTAHIIPHTEQQICGNVVKEEFALNFTDIGEIGELLWSREQQFSLQGTFYYGYLVTLPIAGRLADRFGGKLLFVHSITLQAIVFILTPFFARRNYALVFVARILQGMISGCGNPALYQLFTTWAHPTERTALLSFAYGGYSVGALLTFPLSSFLCRYGWETAFYTVGGVALCFGICFQWLVYSTLDDHPRLSKDEYEYLKAGQVSNCQNNSVPWKSILTSVPVYAFTLTHICQTYGILVFTLMIPRFLKEAMKFSLSQSGIYAAAPFLGSFISKAVTISSFKAIEQRPNLNLTKFRRIIHVISNLATILLILTIIYLDCEHRLIVVYLTLFVGATTDLAFSGAYWPSLLFVAPSFAGLLSGIANCLATFSGVFAPMGISYLVKNGSDAEWDNVMYTLIVAYSIGALIFGTIGSSKLQQWGDRNKNDNNYNNKNDIANVESGGGT